MNFFMEVAKLRAARLLWARADAASSSPKKPESLMLRTHCQTSGVSLTEQDPYNNIVRTDDRGDGGGARRHAEPAHQLVRRGDRAADASSRPRIARNTQLILAEETGVTKVVDPLGGSYYVEALTAQPRRRGAGS